MTTTKPVSKFVGKEFWISELSADEPWRGTILGIFQEGGEWFYDVRADKRTLSLAVRSINWLEPVKQSKKSVHKRRMGKVLRLITS